MIAKTADSRTKRQASLWLGAVTCLGLTTQTFPAHADETAALYVNPHSTTVEAAAKLEGTAKTDALALSKVASATWFTKDTPAVVRQKVADLVERAAAANAVPVLVAYNIPFRDCALYSAGGATDTAAYIAWIKAFAEGIGRRKAIVALEPDGLGVIPWNTDINGDPEICQPTDAKAAHAADERFEQLGRAVDILSALPNATVYLDGTGSSWLSPGDAAQRLIKANVGKADGFFLNVSNYESTDRVVKYARWLSDCLALVTEKNFDAKSCGSQYHPATFLDTATWTKTDEAYDKAFADTGLARDPARQKHAIIDTSRNGLGSWSAPESKYKDAEVWCNPPNRGLGRRPTLETDEPYVDGYLWIKIPGESDGQCYRGTTGPLDPERGTQDPPAGSWFPEQARELISLANPPFDAEPD